MKLQFLEDTYDLVFSVGAACSCTQVLRAAGLQDRSYPLDWVIGGRISDRLSLVTDGFADFFEKDRLKLMVQNRCGNDWYADCRTGIVHNHDFAADADFEADYPAQRAKYERRIARLYDRVADAQKVLLVYIELPNAKRRSRRRLARILAEGFAPVRMRWPTKDVRLVYLRDSPGLFGLPRIRPKAYDVAPGIQVVELRYRDPGRAPDSIFPDFKRLGGVFGKLSLSKGPSAPGPLECRSGEGNVDGYEILAKMVDREGMSGSRTCRP